MCIKNLAQRSSQKQLNILQFILGVKLRQAKCSKS